MHKKDRFFQNQEGGCLMSLIIMIMVVVIIMIHTISH